MNPRDTLFGRPGPGRWFLQTLLAWNRFVRRRATLVLLVSLLSAGAACAYAALNVRIDTSTTDMLSADLPFQKQFLDLDQAFPQDYRTILVVIDADTPEAARSAAERLATGLRARPDVVHDVFYPQGDPFFRREGLLFLDVQQLQKLSDMLASAQPLLASLAQDPSVRGLASVLTLALRNVDQIGGGALPVEFEAALGAIADTVDGVRAGTPAPFSWQGAVLGKGDAQLSGRRQLLLLQPVFDYSSLQPASAIISLIHHLAGEAGLDDAAGVRIRITGEPVMMEDELKSVEDSIGLANVLSLAVVLVILVLGLRSTRLVEATMFSLLVGLALTAGFAVALGPLNLISVAFAVLFIGFGVDFGIHFSLRAKEYIDGGVGPGLALDEASLGVAPGLTLTSISASIGFLAFAPTAYRGLVDLGIISSFGMLVALATSLTIVPAYLSVRTPSPSPRPAGEASGRALEGVVAHHARRILWAALVVGVAAGAAVPFARFDDSPLDLRDPDTESVRTLFDLMQDERFDPFRAAVLAPSAPEAQVIAAKLRALPEVSSVQTAQDFVPDRQTEKLAMLEDLALLLGPVLTPAGDPPHPSPDEVRRSLAELRAAAEAEAHRSPAAARLARSLAGFDPTDVELAALQRSLLADFPQMLAGLSESLDARPVTLEDVPPALLARRETPDGRVLVEVFPKADLRDGAARRQFAEAVQSVVPEATGEAIAVTEAGKAVVRSFFQAGACTFVLISVLLLAVLRSVRDSLMVMAPLVLAGLLTVAATVVLNVPFNFANVIVLPLLFGLGVSSGINMAVRGRQQGSRSLLVTSTPRAVLFSAMTTIGSFGSLALSHHPGMASMGLLLTVALTFGTVCTLTVLPALREIFGRKTRQP